MHQTIEAFEKGLKENHPDIPPSMIYAYAAITSGIPFVNGAPNLTADIPALLALSKKIGVPLSGKDYKTGQTLMKTIIAPGLKSRLIGLEGWYSTNILGNRDGQVLEDPGSFKTKEESKLSVLDQILQPDLYPSLYKDFYHKVAINYYPPRGDNKEGWDCIDIFGWLGYPMQIYRDPATGINQQHANEDPGTKRHIQRSSGQSAGSDRRRPAGFPRVSIMT